jgi:hypothetical protein
LLPKNVKTIANRTIVLPVVLYGCETWSVILKEEHKQELSENRVLRRILQSEGEKAESNCSLQEAAQ